VGGDAGDAGCNGGGGGGGVGRIRINGVTINEVSPVLSPSLSTGATTHGDLPSV